MEIEPGTFEFRVVRVRKDNGETEAILPYNQLYMTTESEIKKFISSTREFYRSSSIGEPRITYKRIIGYDTSRFDLN